MGGSDGMLPSGKGIAEKERHGLAEEAEEGQACADIKLLPIIGLVGAKVDHTTAEERGAEDE